MRIDGLVSCIERPELADVHGGAGLARVLRALQESLLDRRLVHVNAISEARVWAASPQARADVVVARVDRVVPLFPEDVELGSVRVPVDEQDVVRVHTDG